MLSDTNIGIAAVVFGSAVFVAATGPFIFQVVGVLIALVLINYGLQRMGKPPLSAMIQEWFR